MIPVCKEFRFDYGVAHQASPLIRRIVAPNPGRFTGPGTGTLIVGHGVVAVIDPGPDNDAHFNALVRALEGETVSHVLVTHQHNDHSPLGMRLALYFGALLCGRSGRQDDDDHGGDVREEAGDDDWFIPDVEVDDGWVAQGPGWTLQAIHTPGHTSQHFCFALTEENALLCGDHVMAWSTSIVSPPDGAMRDYLESLERIRDLHFAQLYPTHGPEIDSPGPFIDAYIAHRRAREQQILDLVEQGVSSARAIVPIAYKDVDRALHAAALHSVWAHLINLTEQGRIVATPSPTINATYTPAPSLRRHARRVQNEGSLRP